MPDPAHSGERRRSEDATCIARYESPQMLHPDDEGVDDAQRRRNWRQSAIRANAKFLTALAAAGYQVTACG